MDKICSKCKTSHPTSHFFKDKYTKDGFTRACRKCQGHKTPEEILAKKEEKLAHLKTGIKVCVQCKCPNDLLMYCKDKACTDGLTTKCKKCLKLIWGKKREKYKIRLHNYSLGRKYSEKYKTKINQYYRTRRKDPSYRISNNISRGIRRSLKTSKDGRKWESLVGYSISDLIPHLESMFKPGMTWLNYGVKWHIDHIRPVSSFIITNYSCDEFKKCWGLGNLQPLWSEENQSKSNKWDYSLSSQISPS